MRIRHLLAAVLAGACIAAIAAWAIPASAGGPPPGNVPPGHGPHGPRAFAHMDHVFVIMMENTAYDDLLDPNNANTPFIRSLASHNALATKYYGVTHVSLPNYVAATSGSNWGSNSDDEAQADQGYFNHTNIVDQFEGANVSWKGYMENMPSAGFTGNFWDCTSATGPDPSCTGLNGSGRADTGTALYTRKHNPFMQYPDVLNSSQRLAKVVPLTQLTHDLNSGHVARFVWISPNSCNDMHGGPPSCPFANAPGDANQQRLYQDGNDFLQTWVTAITHSRAWNDHSAIFVTWDEGSFADEAPFGPNDTSGCCDSPNLPNPPVNPSSGSGGDLAGSTVYGGGHVPMIVVQRGGGHGITNATPTNHYSLLQTIEQNWHLPFLGNASDTVQVHSLAALLHH